MRKLLSSKFSIVGLFAIIALFLSIPMVVLLSRDRQDIRGKAAEPTPTPVTVASGFGFISGYLYHDDNKNGERDPGEKPFEGVTVRIKQIKPDGAIDEPSKVGNLNTELVTDLNGYFRFRFTKMHPDNTSYSVKAILPDKYKTINTNPLILSSFPRDNQIIVEFGLFPIEDTAVKGAQTTACATRPACLDSKEACLIPEPTNGWCGTRPSLPKVTAKPITPSPTQ